MFPVALSYGKRKFMNLVDLNTGQRLPDIPVQVERAFYSTVLAHYRDEGFQFTEQYWKDNYKTACGFSSDGMLRDMLAKSEREGVTRRQNPTADNSTRVLASVIKLKEKINRLPASASPTAKMR